MARNAGSARSIACRRLGEIERRVYGWPAVLEATVLITRRSAGGVHPAHGIVDGDQTWRLFAPYELVWAGGWFGRMLAQGIYWGTRPVERVKTGSCATSGLCGGRRTTAAITLDTVAIAGLSAVAP